MPEFIISPSEGGTRLDVLLTERLELSRSKIQKLIKAGSITLNGETVRPHMMPPVGATCFYPSAEVLAPPVKTGPAPILDIVYEDDDVMVIEKPAGLIVHEATPEDISPNVVDAILERSPSVADVGDDPRRPGIVHRLDKDVSGLMVIAKTQKAFEQLKQQFMERSVEKEYLALVYGELPEPVGAIDFKITRSKSRGRMVARPESQEGKEALTHYEVVEQLKTTSYVRVKIHTGRTHQIRVHFLALGNPLVGDKLYKIKSLKYNPIEIDRIFLHATKLSFALPSGERKTFNSPLPLELQQILRQVR